jgi:hypothetical protein
MRLRPTTVSATTIFAFTVLEMAMALGLATIVVGTMAMATVFTSMTYEATGNYADLNRASRLALDTMTRDIHQAKTLTSYATNALTFTDQTNGTFSYTWIPGPGTLTRIYNGQAKVLLNNCDSLMFRIFQRCPSNDFSFWPAGTPGDAKLIDVSWICSRSIFGQKMNTEASQTARVAIRN